MLEFQKRLTKIIYSFEPSSLNADLIGSIKKQKFDALRLIHRSGDEEQLLRFTEKFWASYATQEQKPAIMVDISSKVRGVIAASQSQVELTPGKVFTLGRSGGSAKMDVAIETDQWEQFIQPKAHVYFGYADAVAVIREVSGDSCQIEVIQGGAVSPGQDVHIPETRRAPCLDDFESKDLEKIFSIPLASLVIPGFPDIACLKKVRALAQKAKHGEPSIILKINSQEVLSKLETLLDHVDGVLLSRLELAMFVDASTIPLVAKHVAQSCNQHAKVFLTASEIMGSMRTQLTPTRAEVSDVANAVQDGVDGVVLSEEVTRGPFHARAIELMSKIIEDVESDPSLKPNWTKPKVEILDEMDSVAFSAYRCARRVGAKAICCLTKAGNTAYKISSFRTSRPIIALTFDPAVQRKLAIVRGVSSILVDSSMDTDSVLETINHLLSKQSWLKTGDRYVFVSVSLSTLSDRDSNLFTVQTLNA